MKQYQLIVMLFFNVNFLYCVIYVLQFIISFILQKDSLFILKKGLNRVNRFALIYTCQENRHIIMLSSSLYLPNRRYLIKFIT